MLVRYDGKSAEVGGGTKPALARAYMLLAKGIFEGKQEICIEQTANFDTCGIMLDMSFGSVTKVAGVKKYLDYMAKTEIAYNLILQAILKAEGLTPSAADYDKAREEWLEEQRQTSLESGQKVSIDEIIKSIGEDNVRLLSRQQLEAEIVEAFLLEKFTEDYTDLELGC